MSYTKDDYTKARSAVDAAYTAMNSTPEAEAYRDALDLLEAVRESLGVDHEVCEGCEEPIFDGDPKCYDPENCVSTCKECSPTWAEFQGHPEEFLRWEEGADDILYHTPETAAPLIEAHLAKGGALTDSMAT